MERWIHIIEKEVTNMNKMYISSINFLSKIYVLRVVPSILFIYPLVEIRWGWFWAGGSELTCSVATTILLVRWKTSSSGQSVCSCWTAAATMLCHLYHSMLKARSAGFWLLRGSPRTKWLTVLNELSVGSIVSHVMESCEIGWFKYIPHSFRFEISIFLIKIPRRPLPTMFGNFFHL